MALPSTVRQEALHPSVYGIAIGVTPRDATFPIELQRAPDNGSGSPNVGSAVTLATLDAVSLSGTTYYDRGLPNDGAFRHYRWRHAAAPGYDASTVWTSWARGVPVSLDGRNAQASTIFPLSPMAALAGQKRSLVQLASTPELIPNAEFDLWFGDQPAAWEIDPDVTAVRDVATVYSGDSSIKLSNPNNATASGWHGVRTKDPTKGYFSVPVRAGVPYHLRPASRVSAIGGGQQYRVRISFDGGETIQLMKSWIYKAANTWQLDVFSFMVPAGAEANAKIYVEVSRNGSAAATDFWVDSLRLEEVAEPVFFDNGNVTGAVTIDWAKAPTQRVRLIGNITPTFLNGRAGARYVLDVQQDGTGSRLITWPNPVTWDTDTAPTLTTTVDKMDTLGFEVVGDLVQYYRGHVVQKNVTSWDVKSKTFSFDVTSAMLVNDHVVVTGFGFTPKLIILWWTARTEASGEAAGNKNADTGWGAASAAAGAQSWARGCRDDNDVTDTVVGTGTTGQCMTEGSGAGHLAVLTLDTDGVTFNVNATFGKNYRVHGLALGGQTFKAKVGTFVETATVGNQAYTGIGFRPTGLLLSQVMVTGFSDFGQAGPRIGFGSGSGAIGMVGSRAVSGTPTVRQGYNQHLEITGRAAATITSYATLTSLDSDGFTLNWTAPVNGATQGYIALGGCRCSRLNFSTRTDTTNDIVVTGLGLQFRAALLASACRAESTDLAMAADMMLMLGAVAARADGAAPDQQVQVVYSKDAAAQTDVGSGISDAHAYYSLQVAAGPSAPTVAATNHGNSGAAGTSHTINLPASIAVGDLLVVAFAALGNPTITWPAGWTAIREDTSGGNTPRLSIRFRVADGTEGSTISITTGTSVGSAHLSWRITGHRANVNAVPQSGTNALQTALPDSPSVNTGASDNYLWLAIYAWEDGTTTHSAYPTNYSTAQITDRWNNVAGCGIASGARQLTAQTEDPGTASISAIKSWVADTIAIRPGPEPAVSAKGKMRVNTIDADGFTARMTAADAVASQVLGLAIGI